MELQGDGKILLAGWTSVGGFLLQRYDATGALDATFGGGDGIVTTSLGTLGNIAYDVTTQVDGKILITGNSYLGGWDFTLLRYHADGTLDTSFGGLSVPPVDAGESFSVTLPLAALFDDSEGQALSYTFTMADGSALPAWLLASGSALYGTAPLGAPDIALQVTASDTTGASSQLPFTLRVLDPPTDIVVNATAPPSSALPAVGTQVATLSAVDAHGGSISFSSAGGSIGVGSSGAVTVVAPVSPTAVYTIAARATSSDGGTYDQSFDVMFGTAAGDDTLPATGETHPMLPGEDIIYGLGGNDTVYGGSGDDSLFGQDGNDVLIGGTGNDLLSGGSGNDTFRFVDGFGADHVTDFDPTGSSDLIDLTGAANPNWTSFADVQANMTQVGADTVIDLGNGNTITLIGVTATNLTAGDFLL
jgi:uncharacterized delta-60 repeat protein